MKIVLFLALAMFSGLFAEGFLTKTGNTYVSLVSSEVDMSFKADRSLRLKSSNNVLFRFDQEALKGINSPCTLKGIYADMSYSDPIGGFVFVKTVKGTWAEFTGDVDEHGAAGVCSYAYRVGPSTSWDGNGGNLNSVMGLYGKAGRILEPVSVMDEITLVIPDNMVAQLATGEYGGLCLYTSTASCGIAKSAMLVWGDDVAVEDNGRVDLANALSVSPNPFNPSTDISISANLVNNNPKVLIYSISGNVVAKLDMHKSLDNYSVSWNAKNAASGVYLAKIVTKNGIVSKKLYLLK